MRRGLLLSMVVLAMASPAGAQSLFATRGLGVPVPPVDARGRALGGIGVGMFGLNTSLVSPAEVAGIRFRGASAALQPLSGSTEVAGAEDDLSGTRFPLVRLLFPVGTRSVFSVGYGGVLEQSWAVVSEGFEPVGNDSVATRDLIQSSGGIAQVTAGWAYSVTSNFAVGLFAGVYTGNLDRRITRTFTDSLSGLRPFETRLRWDYSGPHAAIGLRWDPVTVVRLGGSFTYAGELDVDGVEGLAEDDHADLPFKATGGLSALLSPQLLLAAGAEYAWGSTGPVFEGAFNASCPPPPGPACAPLGARRRDGWRFGGGIEYEGIRNDDRIFPIRFGGSYAQLPYFDVGESAASEWAASFGTGFRLVTSEGDLPLAVLDATLERGGRSGLESVRNPDGVSESFWRLTFSLSLFGR
jgi:hypothetical protein